MGTKKKRWTPSEVKEVMKTVTKKGNNSKTWLSLAKKLKKSTSAVYNKWREQVKIIEKEMSAETVRPSVTSTAIDAAEQAFKASTEVSANTNSTVPEQEVKVEIADHAKGFIEVKDAKLIHYTNNLLILQVGKEVVIYNI